MGLVWVREQWSKRTGSGNEQSVREYTRSWLILRDSILDDSFTVLATSGLPTLFSLYIGADGVADPLGSLLEKMEAHQPERDQPFLWEVTAHYTNKLDPQLGNPNPLFRPTEISGDFDGFQAPLVIDQYGTPVLSSSNEQFDPPVEKDDSRRTLVMTRNEVSEPDALSSAYADTVNSDTWRGYPELTWKCRPIKYQRMYENNILYWKVTYTFHYNRLTWAAGVLDRGTHWIDDNGHSQCFTDWKGNLLDSPQLLNGEGAPLGKAAGQDGAQSLLVSTNMTQVSTVAIIGAPTGIGYPSRESTYPIVLRFGTPGNFELIQAPFPPDGTTWTGLVRGYNNTTPQAWAVNTPVAMQPYYRTFFPYVQLPFAALNLP